MRQAKRILLEAGTLIVAAFVVGLSVNAVNRNGVDLTRVYFNRIDPQDRPMPTTRPTESNPDGGNGKAVEEVVDSAFQVISTDKAVEWFHDVNPEMPYAYVWVDARKADMYREEHIPGAYLLDHFRVQQYLDAVLPMLQVAEKIIVYCEGGTCEDSTLLATYLLNEVGVPYEKLYVYKDGLEVWRARGFPIAKGDQP